MVYPQVGVIEELSILCITDMYETVTQNTGQRNVAVNDNQSVTGAGNNEVEKGTVLMEPNTAYSVPVLMESNTAYSVPTNDIEMQSCSAYEVEKKSVIMKSNVAYVASR